MLESFPAREAARLRAGRFSGLARRGRLIAALESDAPFLDIGTEASLALADEFIRRNRGRFHDLPRLRLAPTSSRPSTSVPSPGQPFSRPRSGRHASLPIRCGSSSAAIATTAQLDYTVPKEVMFSDHTYLSGIDADLERSFPRAWPRRSTPRFAAASRQEPCSISARTTARS